MELIPFSDPMLKHPPKPVDFEKDDVEKISQEMIQYMSKVGGAGLSANQVGEDLAMFVMGGFGNTPIRVVVNPKLQSVSETQVLMEEGCLSYPGLRLKLKRPDACALSYQNEKGETVVEKFEGVEARVVLHEYDHMVGQNFTQRASPLKIQRAMKKLDKKVKNYKRMKGMV
jgi:peptide deformylase